MNKNKVNSIIKYLESKKCYNIDYYDLKNKNFIFDQCVVATCLNARHLNSIKDELEDFLSQKKVSIHHVEGKNESGWIIIDCNEIIFHLFTEDERNRIKLDELFNYSFENVK